MNQDPVTIDRIDWLKVWPSLHLLQSAGLAWRLRVVVPSLLAVMFASAGNAVWNSDRDDENVPDYTADVDYELGEPRNLFLGLVAAEDFVGIPVVSEMTAAGWGMGSADGTVSWWSDFKTLLAGVFVLAFSGVAIMRAAATAFCKGTRAGVFSSLSFAGRSVRATLLSTFLAGGMIAALLALISAAGWLISCGWMGESIVAIVWPLVRLTSIFAVVGFVVIGLGWLLSLAAIGTDQCSGSDALSRGISYVLSHKVRSAWYLLIVASVARVGSAMSTWLLEAADQILASRIPDHFCQNDEGMVGMLMFCWLLIESHLPQAIALGAFCCGIARMYILLRKEEDAVPLREMNGAAVQK